MAQQQRPPFHPATGFPAQAVTYQRKPTAHGFHIVMSIITAGMWFLLVYLPLLVIRSRKQRVVTRFH